MEKPHRIAQIYGYTVCLITIITFIIGIANLVNAFMDLTDPMHAVVNFNMGGPSLASFENYKMDILKAPSKEGTQNQPAYIPDEQTLRSMYEAAKNDKMEQARHITNKSIIVNGLLLLISVILFLIHWIWMQKLTPKLTSLPGQ